MKILSQPHSKALWLLSALFLFLQSCEETSVPLEKSKVQFALSPGSSPEGRSIAIDLPDNAGLRISIESGSGAPVYTNHELRVSKVGDAYVADDLELQPGSYVVTDFMVVEDSVVLNATPKGKSTYSSFVKHSLPYKFSVSASGVARVNMEVLNARNEKPESFGYAFFRLNKINWLPFLVTQVSEGEKAFGRAYAEIRQGKQLIKRIPARKGMNVIAFQGEPDAVYTLSVFGGETAKMQTFNLKELKSSLRGRPLKMALEPALLLTMESYVEEGNPNEDFYEFALDGVGGRVNVNWGDGDEESHALPMNAIHEYTMGAYTSVITGDLDQVTNLHGFSYSTIMSAITGLTNLTNLRTYNPSWGAVPIKVDLSNCKKLETISIAKYGAPYETVDLRTDFKLPDEHFIKEFIFDAPSFDMNREKISAEELEVFVDNIYNNSTRRSIKGGKFYIYPVENPLPETQEKLDILENDYNWDVRLNDNIWESSEGGRTKQDLNTRRANWLQEKFPHSKNLARGVDREFAF